MVFLCLFFTLVLKREQNAWNGYEEINGNWKKIGFESGVYFLHVQEMPYFSEMNYVYCEVYNFIIITSIPFSKKHQILSFDRPDVPVLAWSAADPHRGKGNITIFGMWGTTREKLVLYFVFLEQPISDENITRRWLQKRRETTRIAFFELWAGHRALALPQTLPLRLLLGAWPFKIWASIHLF